MDSLQIPFWYFQFRKLQKCNHSLLYCHLISNRQKNVKHYEMLNNRKNVIYCFPRPITITIVGLLYTKAVQIYFRLLNGIRTGLYNWDNCVVTQQQFYYCISLLLHSKFPKIICKSHILQLAHTCAASIVAYCHLLEAECSAHYDFTANSVFIKAMDIFVILLHFLFSLFKCLLHSCT